MAERFFENGRSSNELPIQYIEYRGEVLKSRTEVQWAFIYQQLGIRYQYEPQPPFVFIDGMQYTPDFYLPDFNCFVETKRDNLGMHALHKAINLSLHTGCLVYIFDGIQTSYEAQRNSESAIRVDQDRVDFKHRWCECYRCKRLSIEKDGDERLIQCGCTKKLDKRKKPNQERIHTAFSLALTQIQFIDHGDRRMSAVTPDLGRWDR
jgi:hypothetical protein